MSNVAFRAVLGVAGLASIISGVSATAATVAVTAVNFGSAMATAQSGDTLKLVGTFGYEEIVSRTFASTVTIDARGATFTDRFVLRDSSNINILGGTYNIVGANPYTRAISVSGGRNININGITALGSPGGQGIVFNGTTNATVMNSRFNGLQVAMVFGTVTHGIASHNAVTGAGSDGIDIANSHFVTAANNVCSGSVPTPGAHPDCIQLWSVTGNPLQSDITVKNNSATGATQGFTAFNSMGGELRVQITGNSIDGSFPQGIACYSCVDSNISYNKLVTLPGAAHLTNLNIIGGSGNTVLGNIITPYAGPQVKTNVALASLELTDGDMANFGPPDLATLVGPMVAGSAATVPEPASWMMLISGFFAIGLVRRRRPRGAVVAA